MIPPMPWTASTLPDDPAPMRALARAVLDAAPAANGIADASDALVIVPASRARRSFERHLFDLARERGVAAIAPHVVTPGALLARFTVPSGAALGAIGERAAWLAAIDRCGPDELAALFPEQAGDAGPDERSREAVAERIASLHRECAAAGHRFSAVAAHVESTMPDADPARWRALATVAAAREALLAEAGAADRALDAIDAVAAGRIRFDGIRRVHVFLADPDPVQRALLRAMAARGVDVRSMIHADADALPAPLDGDRCPDHQAWSVAAVDVGQERILRAGAPADQAAAVMDAIAAVPLPRRTDEIAVAVPDPAVAAEVSVRLPSWGVPVSAPPGRSAAEGPLGILLAAVAEWLACRSCDALGQLVRVPDVERWLEAARVRDPIGATAAFAARSGARTVPPAGSHEATAGIDGVIRAVDGLLSPVTKARTASAAASALRAVLDALVRPVTVQDRDAGDAAREALDELAALPRPLDRGPSPAAWVRMIRESMASATLPSSGAEDGIELMGWLEAGIDDAPHLVLTGMNEGIVPEGLTIDPWLPDSARERLGMQCARRRRARDAWILHGLLRRKRSVCLVTGRTTAEGERLRPSRLLLGVRGTELAERVLWLTGEQGAVAQAVRWQGTAPANGLFGPSLVPEGESRIARISVTSFRDWFASPALFRLRRDPRIKLTDAGGPATELDPMTFGTLVHDALEAWGRRAAERSAAGEDPETDAGVIEREVLEAFDEVRSRQFVPDVRGAYEVQFALAVERLRAFARVQAGWASCGWRVVRAEQQFDTFADATPAPELGSTGIRLCGRIDRVDLHDELGYAALDYKTSSEASPPEAAHRKPRTGEWVDLQLPLYRVLLGSTGIEVKPSQLGYFALPSNPADAKVLLAEEWDDDFAREAEAEACRIAALVAAGDFSGDRYRPQFADDPFAPVFCEGMRGLRQEASP